MSTTTQPKPKLKRAAGKPQTVVKPAPRPRTGRPKPTRSRRGIFLPCVIILAMIATHLTSLAMLHYENARLVQLRRETDRVKLNIEKLRGQIAVYTDEIAINRWAEQAGMVRVETQPELTIIGLDAPTMPAAPVAMRPAE
ncbi:MAG: hypothetical protein KatS3mg016_0229 [Fimbriimonadales bacterium]|nr:MAG: hypothetical protein KatS3mg016_0229 [Fimbriimonadales bacterium]